MRALAQLHRPLRQPSRPTLPISSTSMRCARAREACSKRVAGGQWRYWHRVIRYALASYVEEVWFARSSHASWMLSVAIAGVHLTTNVCILLQYCMKVTSSVCRWFEPSSVCPWLHQTCVCILLFCCGKQVCWAKSGADKYTFWMRMTGTPGYVAIGFSADAKMPATDIYWLDSRQEDAGGGVSTRWVKIERGLVWCCVVVRTLWVRTFAEGMLRAVGS